MRSRRQIVSDSVSILGMDPWKDDRVRDFVAINTIQRLRAYHLPADAPMPAMQEANTARALNLLLLPRADPDYRPCLGEQPPPRLRRRGLLKQKTSERRQDKANRDDNVQLGTSPNFASARLSSSSSSSDGSDIDGDSVARKACTGAISATPSTQCAIDRARSVFFGSLSFTSSTSPRRLVNSPHVMLTPSAASTATTPFASEARVGHRRFGGEESAGTTSDVWINGVPPTASPSLATRSLGVELDAYIELNSTPLRPPPPIKDGGALDEVSVESLHGLPSNCAAAGDEKTQPETVAPLGQEEQSDSLQMTPAAAPPPTPGQLNLDGSDTITPPHNLARGSSDCVICTLHSCDVCDVIIQYYQAMLTRGVVLDRYNHKDLAFVWWVLGCNMDVAALEKRGPMRREALMITLRNFYYTLLSAEEAKTKAGAGAKTHSEGTEFEGTSSTCTVAPPSSRVTVPRAAGVTVNEDGRGVMEGMESPTKRSRSKAVMSHTEANDAFSIADATNRSSRHRSRDSHPAVGQSRPDNNMPSSNSDDSHSANNCDDTSCSEAGDPHALPAKPKRGKTTRLPPEKVSDSTETSDLATALQKEDARETATAASAESVDTMVGNREDVLHKSIESGAGSLLSSPTASRACSVSQGSSRDVHPRRRRCAAERNKAVEETWVSTRTGRRAAAIKAAAQLELQGSTDSTAHRISADALSAAKPHRASKTATAKTLTEELSVTAAAKNIDGAVVSAPPPVPDCSDTTSRVSRRKNTASKRTRSPSLPTYPVKGNEDQSSDTNSDGDEERIRGEEKTGNAKTSQRVSHGTGSKSKSRAAATAKEHVVKSEKGNISAALATSMASASANLHSPDTTTVPPVDSTNTTTTTPGKVSVAAASKKSGRVEEHRGRPCRGGLKTLRIDPAVPEEQGNGVLTTVARSSQRRREGGPLSTTILRGTSAERAESDQRTDAAGKAVGILPPSSVAQVGEDTSRCELRVLEIPLHLTPNERTVRTRIQQRMGVPLAGAPPHCPSGSASHHFGPDAQPITLYSSYTFLLSSFKMATGTYLGPHGNACMPRATTAPGLWYGPAPSTDVANASTSGIHRGADASKPEGETRVGLAFKEDALPKRDAPTLSASRVTAAVPTARQRGRKRRIEGGVDACLRGNVLRHDQMALERLLENRNAQSTVECGQPAESPVASSIVQVKRELRSSSGEEDIHSEKEHVAMTSAEVVDHEVVSPAPVTGSSCVTTTQTLLGSPRQAEEDVSVMTGETFLTEQLHNDSAQRTPSPQTTAFGDLPYAQKCLLVWSAAGLLERHSHQLYVAEARRERLLARCGRMATRRMAARVAAVAQASMPEANAHGKAEDAAEQLVGEFVGSDVTSDSDASGEKDLSEGERAAAKSRCPVGGRPSEVSRNVGDRGHSHFPERANGQPTASRSSSTASSSASSEDRVLSTRRPLPRRVYDYWAAYRGHRDNG